MATVSVKRPEVVTPPATITLEMTEDEAAVVATILGQFAGGADTVEGHLFSALTSEGVNYMAGTVVEYGSGNRASVLVYKPR